MAAQLRPRAYLDFDVDDACAKFKRASHFVESCDLKYALSSKKIDELGGGEILRLPELYANDFEWSAKGQMRARPQPNCRVVFELYEDIAPLAVENFLALCRGDRGVDKGSGVKLHYKGCPVHRVVKGFVMQGGDIVKGNGSGGASCFGKKFKDETKGLRLKHDRAGVLSMGNSGKRCGNHGPHAIDATPSPYRRQKLQLLAVLRDAGGLPAARREACGLRARRGRHGRDSRRRGRGWGG